MEPTPEAVDDTCLNGTDYSSQDNAEAGFSGVVGFEAWGDGVTTLCLQQDPGRICAHGVAGGSGDEYAAWGAGFSLTLTSSLEQGRNLNELGIVGVRMGLSQVVGRHVRVMATQADDPRQGGGPNYADNAFVYGGSSPSEFSSDQTLILGLGDFSLPAWTLLTDDTGTPLEGQMINPRKVSSLQVMIVNNPNDTVTNYSFCVTDFAFIDAAGEEVPLPIDGAQDAGVDGSAPTN